MKPILNILLQNLCKALLIFVIVLSTACQSRRQRIHIFFDNDVHCAIDVYGKMAALRDSVVALDQYVSVVSAGDFVQGGAVGTISRGEYVVEIMNLVPYDFVTLGNHEFDYGMNQLKRLIEQIRAKVLACNFSYVDGTFPYAPYAIQKYGPVKVAFVGVITPTTYTSSTPTNFMDSLGNLVYNFHMEDTYELVQQAVNSARANGATYVFLLSHLGDDTMLTPSPELIASTTGIDAVLDGHAHHFIDKRLPNLDGDSVWLLSTGAAGERIGHICLDIDGQWTHDFYMSSCLTSSPSVMEKTAEIQARLEQEIGRPVGYNECLLSDKDANGKRLVRNSETALAQFTTDAIRQVLHTDIALLHGGSIRAALPQGPITLGDLITVFPFNNYAARVQMTGQQIVDALEVGVATFPDENGDFMIASGLRYAVNPSVPSSVKWNEDGLFISTGKTRRIQDVEIFDPSSQSWTPISLSSTYTVGGLDYALLKQGVSGAFRFAKPMSCEDIKDTEILSRYISTMNDTIHADMYPTPVCQPRFRVID